jgi:hypothetical protein
MNDRSWEISLHFTADDYEAAADVFHKVCATAPLNPTRIGFLREVQPPRATLHANDAKATR